MTRQNRWTIHPIDLQEILDPEMPDVIVAASGYEPRCTFLMEQLSDRCRGNGLEIGRRLAWISFSNYKDLPTRQEADRIFRRLQPRWDLEVSTDEGVKVRQFLDQIVASCGVERPRVLIDYSAMSRMLYLSALDISQDVGDPIYSYSIGRYENLGYDDFPISTVGTIRGVPGLEGLPYVNRPRLYVFGLGFDGVGVKALIDRLEVGRRVVVYWADPGAFPDASSVTVRNNQKLIEKALVAFSVGLHDVRGAARMLEEVCLHVEHTDKVLIVPVGPKPLILAGAIVAAQYDHVTLLAPHLSGGGVKSKLPLIEPSGELVITRLQRGAAGDGNAPGSTELTPSAGAP